MPSAPPTPDLKRDNPDTIAGGIALRIAAAGLFSVMSALLKLATTHGVVAPELVFWRALFGLPVVVVWALTTQGGVTSLKTQRPGVHVFRCVLGVSALMCNFQALSLLALADATTIGFTAPIFATLLSGLILKEAVGRHRWAAVLIGFVGVAVVLHGGSGPHVGPSLVGVAVGLVGALGTAGVTVTLRQLKDTEQVAAIVFWFFVASIGVGAVLLPFFGSWHGPAVMALLAGGGVAGGLAQICMTASLRQAPVAVIAPFDYLQIVGAVLFGWWLLATTPTMNTLAGAALIAASGLYTVWRERVRHKERMIQSTSAPV